MLNMQTNIVPAKQSTSTDLMIRFLHMVMLLSFTGAYLTGDVEEWHQLHMAFGYTLGISLAITNSVAGVEYVEQ